MWPGHRTQRQILTKPLSLGAVVHLAAGQVSVEGTVSPTAWVAARVATAAKSDVLATADDFVLEDDSAPDSASASADQDLLDEFHQPERALPVGSTVCPVESVAQADLDSALAGALAQAESSVGLAASDVSPAFPDDSAASCPGSQGSDSRGSATELDDFRADDTRDDCPAHKEDARTPAGCPDKAGDN
jgi:hypothetical protein